MSSVNGTIQNDQNVYNRLSEFDGFPVCMNEWATSANDLRASQSKV